MNQDPEKQSAVDCFRATVTDALVVACCCHVYIRPASGAGIDFIASIPLRSARMIIRQILALVLITHVTTNFETDHNEQSRKSSRRNCANDCSPVFCCVSRRKNMFVSWFFSTIWLSFFAALVGIAFFVVQNPKMACIVQRGCVTCKSPRSASKTHCSPKTHAPEARWAMSSSTVVCWLKH